MSTHPYLDQGISILHAKMQTPSNGSNNPWSPAPNPFLTLSSESCAGATTLGEYLLPLLDQHLGREGRSWMFLDKDLLHHALNQKHLSEHLAQFLPEDRLPEVQGLIGEIVGLHPSLWEVEHLVAEAILQSAQLGGVILAGRAAHLITRSLPGGFHVRLVAPVAERIQRMQAHKQCDPVTAAGMVHEADGARRRFIRANFGSDINDPCSYDLIINTEQIAINAAADLVLRAMQLRVKSLTHR